jgi:hypothetical protein
MITTVKYISFFHPEFYLHSRGEHLAATTEAPDAGCT